MSQSNTPADPGAESSVDTGHLFDEFQAVSREAWEQKIRKDLKLETDAGYEKRILWRTAEGFVIQPFYDAADLNGLESPDAEPGRFPFLRGRSGADNRWEIREEIYDADPAVANRRALAALEAGVDSVCFVIAAEGGRMRGVDLTGDVAAAFQTLLAGVWLDAAPIHFRAGAAAPLIVALLHAEVQRQKLDPARIFGTVDYDPMRELAEAGELDTAAAFATAAALIQFTRENLPGLRPLAVSDHAPHNAGAGIVESLALSLAAGNEMLAGLSLARDADGAPASAPGLLEVCGALSFDVSISSNYFMEIARLRAARLLWSRIVLEYAAAASNATATSGAFE
ncbi:MAG: methylmalonyl-CoA mutase family protein, partial [Leptospirales bacterium]